MSRSPEAVQCIGSSFIYDKDYNVTDPAHIVWSSSDSELSDNGTKAFQSVSHGTKEFQSNVSHGKQSTCKRVSLSMERCIADETPQITGGQYDSDIECEEENTKMSDGSAVEISDSESSSSNSTGSQLQKEVESSNVKAMDIAEYSSDDAINESIGPVWQTCLPANHSRNVDSPAGKRASEWLKTAQVLLKTPDKKIDKAFKTPEDSAKKRKRFLRGGLAERLNRLQNRERSAISFWRHQCKSDCKITIGAKSGILLLRVDEIHEECSMKVVSCTKLESDNGEASSSCHSNYANTLIILFTRQTASQLRLRPKDVIHIHPPWQQLNIQDNKASVIVNTHFTQKMIPNRGTSNTPSIPDVFIVRRKSVPLSLMLKVINDQNYHGEETGSSKEKKHSLYPNKNDSLLDVVETRGAAGWTGTCLSVMVQRVYCIPLRDKVGQFQAIGETSFSANKLSSSDFCVCFLVQDAYGIFSELHLQTGKVPDDHLQDYVKRWEGKTCRITGMKILQRVTRGRAPGLFSLIDSLWPPLVPIKVHGQTQHQQVEANLQIPSFCYILSMSCDEIVNDGKNQFESLDSYVPPVFYNLREIFKINVSIAPLQEIWMYVTDSTVQEEPVTHDGMRVLSVCISPSCLLDCGIWQTLCKKMLCAIYFKDAVKENGRIICVERTVLSLQKPFLSCFSQVKELTGDVLLSDLDSAIQANELCSVTGLITGVNEETAFSWPVCNICESSKLQRPPTQESHSSTGSYFCSNCLQYVSIPVIRMHLEVSLHCDFIPGCRVKLKLQQETISLILKVCTSEDGCYEVSSVLGKKVGPLNCYVQSITSHPNTCIELEEICLFGRR
ncbi:hypothetical protein GDO86_011031 [Hymenochirus boettgeri]|uniref:DNA repair-scaffolding protein n=1 Tax=Hymenochirus boettgeri TaxID=247094 RepID=A0A8T2JCL3_9PIPI|nr:hypothetical protein GDO86_011031 [Hymenochirus boettgeri]